MDNTAQILRQIVHHRQVTSLVCKVDEVHDLDCDVTPVDGTAQIKTVRLKAYMSGDKGIVIKPKKGSFVLIIFLKVNDAFVAMMDEVDSIQYKIEGGTFFMDKDGLSADMGKGKYEIKNTQESLKKLLDDLNNAIMQLTVTTGTGPSGTPINIASFQDIQQRIPKLFK